MKQVIIFISSLILSGNAVGQIALDWRTLTITRFCTVDKKYCENRLTIDAEGMTSFEPCEQKVKYVSIDNKLLDKIRNINTDKIKHWIDITHIDTVCGYLIKLDKSDRDFVYFDINPSLYDDQEVKDYIGMLNTLFKKIK